jgi:predicted RNA-binding protein with RPS1 domain
MEQRVQVGDIIDVTITGIQPYGAFALLPDHSTGLIHISEISDKFVRNIESFVKVGEKITVKVIDIDGIHHQAKLSLKAVYQYKRKHKRGYRSQRKPIIETPKGFAPLKELLPIWIEAEMKEEK